jgi:DICT domain-containing protein
VLGGVLENLKYFGKLSSIMAKNKTIIAVLVILLIVGVSYYFLSQDSPMEITGPNSEVFALMHSCSIKPETQMTGCFQEIIETQNLDNVDICKEYQQSRDVSHKVESYCFEAFAISKKTVVHCSHAKNDVVEPEIDNKVRCTTNVALAFKSKAHCQFMDPEDKPFCLAAFDE